MTPSSCSLTDVCICLHTLSLTLWCADGMLGYENALKITNTPFPFPFAQCVALLLHINAIVAPALLADWLSYPWLAGAVTFINVFVMYLLNEVSLIISCLFVLPLHCWWRQ